MLKHKIQPTIKSLVMYVRGTSWTQEESTTLLSMIDQIKKEIKLGTKPQTTKTFIEKLKSSLNFR